MATNSFTNSITTMGIGTAQFHTMSNNSIVTFAHISNIIDETMNKIEVETEQDRLFNDLHEEVATGKTTPRLRSFYKELCN